MLIIQQSIYFYINCNFVTTFFLIFLIINKTYYVTILYIITSFFIAIYLRFLIFINILEIKLFIIKISLYLIISFVFTYYK